MRYSLFFLILLAVTCELNAQKGSVAGRVSSPTGQLEFVNIQITGTEFGAVTDGEGSFFIEGLPLGEVEVVASYIGYRSSHKKIRLDENKPNIDINFSLIPSDHLLEGIVVTGTKTFKRQTRSPVIVNILSNTTMDNVQACNISDGLKFQPGLRVEVDCQTCNYTQLRMNGLSGGYSQILINGRPIFSPLTGLYGMEQIPTNMVERIEIVRGGGSALYGSSAIGGTVNVITKIPKKNNYDIGYTHQNINGNVNDRILAANASIINKKGNAGASFFINNRWREAYDHNGDQFSELPQLNNNSFGTNLFYQPKPNQKLELSLSNLNEYRYGGEISDLAAHLVRQSEERKHHIWIGSLDYQINFNSNRSSFITYFAGQNTQRDHFTGISPDPGSEEFEVYLRNPPYGYSANYTWQGGIQFNHQINRFLSGSNIITFGSEYVFDDVLDVIETYNYRVDQLTRNLGFFLQSDWKINESFNLLTGLRADKHNLVEKIITSPRLSLLYRYKDNTQFRITWGTGFRAPQAFDADLHIAFAGGGISRISIAEDLKEERSNSISGSVNYDKATGNFVAGFTLEGFFTHLRDAFYQHPLGADNFGERFEKRNGAGSKVKGGTLEIRANYRQKAQLEAGITVQTSLYDQPVENIEGLNSLRKFLRTPNEYGYAAFSFFPNKNFKTSLNLVYTGKMTLAHFAGAPGVEQNTYVDSRAFTNLSIKTGYTFLLNGGNTGLEFFGGIKNITNAYQNDFDLGKNRDSNYVYGPATPRTIFIGLRIKSF